jgi:DNA-binding LytR/AlgR family response regulator
MNCIIVDDDKVSGKVLEGYIKKNSSLTLLGSFDSSLEARNLLTNRNDIELVFLDIMMPEMDGFDFLASLESPPNIIITSSEEGFAAKAYDFNVVDYLIKPITYGRFCKAVDKVSRYFTGKVKDIGENKEVFVKSGNTLVKLILKNIVYIEALENYIMINTQTDKYTVHFTMKAISELMPSSIFVRTHRSFIVNKSMIKTITDSSVDLYNGSTIINIPLGKSFRDELLNDINLMVK